MYYTYIHTYIHVFFALALCACVQREREREREREVVAHLVAFHTLCILLKLLLHTCQRTDIQRATRWSACRTFLRAGSARDGADGTGRGLGGGRGGGGRREEARKEGREGGREGGREEGGSGKVCIKKGVFDATAPRPTKSQIK
jgi:hypothetical protein